MSTTTPNPFKKNPTFNLDCQDEAVELYLSSLLKRVARVQV